MRRLAPLSLLLALAACSGGTDTATSEPPDLTGTWTLATVDGAPPPVTLSTSVAVGTVTLTAGWLRVQPSGVGTYLACERTVPPAGSPFPPSTHTREEAVAVTADGAGLFRVLYVQRATIDTGTVRASTLTFRRRFEEPDRVLTYTKTSADPAAGGTACPTP